MRLEFKLAQIAQLGEHTTEDRGVAGSIPALGSLFYFFSKNFKSNRQSLPTKCRFFAPISIFLVRQFQIKNSPRNLNK